MIKNSLTLVYEDLRRDSKTKALTENKKKKTHEELLGMYSYNTRNISLGGAVTKFPNVESISIITINHEMMHKLIHKLEDRDAAWRYDLIAANGAIKLNDKICASDGLDGIANIGLKEEFNESKEII